MNNLPKTKAYVTGIGVVSPLGEDIKKSRDTVYSATSEINWKGCYFRKDIGFRIIN